MTTRCPGCSRIKVELPSGGYGWAFAPKRGRRRSIHGLTRLFEPEWDQFEMCSQCRERALHAKPAKEKVKLPENPFEGMD